MKVSFSSNGRQTIRKWKRRRSLVKLQVQLACWQLNWVTVWGDPVQRNQIAERSRIWSDRILEL